MRKWDLQQKLARMYRRKPRPQFQLEAELIIGMAQKVAMLGEKARAGNDKEGRVARWGAFFDAMDEYRYRKNKWLEVHCPAYVPEEVKHLSRYEAPTEDEATQYVSPNEEDYEE